MNDNWVSASTPPKDLKFVHAYIPHEADIEGGSIVTAYLLNGQWRLNTMDGDPGHIIPAPSHWQELISAPDEEYQPDWQPVPDQEGWKGWKYDANQGEYRDGMALRGAIAPTQWRALHGK